MAGVPCAPSNIDAALYFDARGTCAVEVEAKVACMWDDVKVGVAKCSVRVFVWAHELALGCWPWSPVA